MMRSLTLASMGALLLAACGQPEAVGTTVAPPTGDQPAAGVPLTVGAVEPEVRQFRDWSAVCDNGGRCMAYTGSADGWIRIQRDAGPSADGPCIGFGLGFSGQDDTPSPVVLSADGTTMLRVQGRDGAYCADASTGTPPDALITLADAQTLTLAGGDRTGSVPAAGLKAALLWIDERQGRLDTPTALIRRGARPVSAVPAAPVLPRVTPAPPADQTGFRGDANPLDRQGGAVAPASVEALAAVRECRAQTNEVLRAAVLAVRLGPAAELWGIPCDAGAYNATYAIYVTGPGGANPRPAELPTREPRAESDPGGPKSPWLVNPVYDPRAQTLTVFPRGRGLGDCGTITTWTWTGQAFALSNERFMGECVGMNRALWPTLWRTR